jgi:DNA-binding response OmpR family regulator
VQSVEDFFELIDKVRPDLILLDVKMPDCDGYEVVEKLKKNEKYKDIPVIFLTSDYNRHSIIKGMELGAADFVKKPFIDVDLIKCIEQQFETGNEKDKRPVILAVDDNPSILKAVNSLLRDRYSVYTLPEPSKIIPLLEMITPDLFLLDCKMPDISGFELVPIIRKLRGHEETPIVFLTSEGTVDNISVAINLGACDFIIKPIDENVLLEKTALYLKSYKIRRRIRSIPK